MTNSITLTVELDGPKLIKAGNAMIAMGLSLTGEIITEIEKEQEAIIEGLKPEDISGDKKPNDWGDYDETNPDDYVETTPSEVFIQDIENATVNESITVDVELDVNGLPWDARIHAGTKSKNAPGDWKKKRGVDPELVKQVEAELRGVTVPEEPAPVVDTPSEPVNVGITFPQLISKITASQAMGRVKPVLDNHGIASLPELNGNDDLIAVVYAELFPEG